MSPSSAAGRPAWPSPSGLRRLGLRFGVLDAGPEIGHVWQSRWDSLRLFTPARYDALPGMTFPGRPDTHPGKDAVADYLRDYAAAFNLPVRTNSRVTRLCRTHGGEGYQLLTADRTLHVLGKGAVTIVDGRHVKTDAYRGKGYKPLMVSGAVLHSLPSGYWYDLRGRRLLAAEHALDDEREASE